MKADDGKNENTTGTFAAASGSPKGTWVSAARVPALGTGGYNGGVNVFAWAFEGKPYVAVVAVQGYAGSTDLKDFFEAKFAPR